MKKVLAGGVFGVIHPGHEFFLKKAKAFGDFLVVVVASDKTTCITKKYPVIGAETRKRNLEALGIADRVVIGDDADFMKVVRQEKPDVIVLGYDQKMSEKELEKLLQKNGIECEIARIKENLRGHKTSKIIKK